MEGQPLSRRGMDERELVTVQKLPPHTQRVPPAIERVAAPAEPEAGAAGAGPGMPVLLATLPVVALLGVIVLARLATKRR